MPEDDSSREAREIEAASRQVLSAEAAWVGRPLQEKVETLLCEVLGGPHRVPKLKVNPFHISCRIGDGISTYDFDVLTRLVIKAHDHCVRLEIVQGGPGHLRLMFHNRVCRSGGRFFQRHPTLESAIGSIRG